MSRRPNASAIRRMLAGVFLASFAGVGVTRANIILNPGFLFTAPGHVDGDSGKAANVNSTNVPDWPLSPTSVDGLIATDPQSIFNNVTNEYIQVQTTNGLADIYQQVSLVGGNYTLQIQAEERNDLINTGGSIIFQLWSGAQASFATGSALVPTTFSLPVLTTNFQTLSETFNALPAGTYTVRIGGVNSVNGVNFQAALDNASLTGPVPEPTSLCLIGMGGITLLGRRPKADHR